jgi:CRP/FNR family transcriptional regulator
MYAPHLAPQTLGAPAAFALAPAELADLSQIFAGQPVEKLQPGEAVFWQADPATDVVEVTEGCLRRYRVLVDGRRAITGFAFPGDVLGLSTMDQYSDTAEAVTPVKLRRVSRRRFHALVDTSAQLRPQVLARMCQEITLAQEQMILLGQKGAEERVASFLLTLACRSEDLLEPVDVVVPMSRLDMADYLGLTIETVCRSITKLKDAGFIILRDRRTIRLCDIAALRQQAGEEEETLCAPTTFRGRATRAH